MPRDEPSFIVAPGECDDLGAQFLDGFERPHPEQLLDLGWSCELVAAAFLLDDTVRDWYRAYERGSVEGLKSFGHEGGSSRLTDEQEVALGDWVDNDCPRSIRKVGAWVRRTYGLSYSRSGLIALLHRLGFDYRKPDTMPRGLDDVKQQAFIDRCDYRYSFILLGSKSPLCNWFSISRISAANSRNNFQYIESFFSILLSSQKLILSSHFMA
jgi:transposase